MPVEHIVMYSGGLGSFWTAKWLIEKEGIRPRLLFADTEMEDEDLYRFLAESSKLLGCELVRITKGKTPWDIFNEVRFLGNTRIDPCSMHLKRNFCDQWIAENYTPETVVVCVGIDASEAHRIRNLAPRKLPWIYRAPLVEAEFFFPPREQKLRMVREAGVEPPRLYAMGFQHNNCGGFCVKAGLAQFKLLHERMPERYDWHVQQERKLRAAVPGVRPFLRKTVNGKLNYVWLEEYREFLRGGEELTGEERFDWGGCGCALENTEEVGVAE